MLSSKVTAIVLKRINFGEADRIVTVFSRQRGKLNLVAKGVRRIKSRRAPHLEPLTEVSVVLHTDIITEAKSTRPFNLRSDFKTLGLAFYAAEIIDKLLPENEPHEDVYELLRNFLASSELTENKVKEFTASLLWTLGFLPRGTYPKEGLTTFVESLAERRVRSKQILDNS